VVGVLVFALAIQPTKSYVINELGWVSLLDRLQLTTQQTTLQRFGYI
jgi:hypothetical protein